MIYNGAVIENNTAGTEGTDNTYPDLSKYVDWTKDESLNLQEISVELQKKYVKGEGISKAYAQGMTITSKYIVMAQINSEKDNTYINIIDKDTFEILNTINDYNFGHANAVTYNPNEDKCYISYQKNSQNYITSFKINDKYELEDIKDTEVNYYYWT